MSIKLSEKNIHIVVRYIFTTIAFSGFYEDIKGFANRATAEVGS